MKKQAKDRELMWNWSELSRRQAAASVGILLIAVLATGSFVFAVQTHRRLTALDARFSTAARTVDAQLVRLEERIETMPPRAAKEYLLRTCGTQIGIYDGTGAVLYELLAVDVRTLPAIDRAMLEAGSLVTGEASLRALIEDYSS